MKNFYQQPPHREELPEPSISDLTEPIPVTSQLRTNFPMPTTEKGMKEVAFIHTGKALVELDRVFTCLTKLGMTREANQLTKHIEALDELRTEIDPPAKKYRNGLEKKAR